MKIYERRAIELKYTETHKAYALVQLYEDSLRMLHRCKGKSQDTEKWRKDSNKRK
jgi:hypothetical protein